YAVDAVTGEEKWSYDPQVPREWGRRACCDVVNRGVAVYKGHVYFGSLDGRLISLNAQTGEKVWEVDTIIDRDRFYTVTGAPRVANDKVFIGNGGAEFGVRGYVTAYDAQTGDEVWRFFTVPGDPAQPAESDAQVMAAETWKGTNYWEYGGGGTVWNSIVYDPDLNSVYLGVGNGSPWTRELRSPGGGDNLFLSSIVALDADSGEYKWHYQTTPGDNWDYTAVQDIALADMTIDGVDRKVLLQAPKNGFFYVLDRTDGSLLRANQFAAVTWASHVDMETGRPVEVAANSFDEQAQWVLPGPLGAHNWQAMSVDVEAGIAYIPVQENALIYAMSDEYYETGLYKRHPGRMNLGLEFGRIAQLFIDNIAEQPKVKGYLKAFNFLTGEEKWAVEFPHFWNGGVLATEGGLVFQGNVLGMFAAYDASTGEVLWDFNTYVSMLAPPITYQIDGVQYVSILTGTGGGDLFSGAPLDPVPNPASLTYSNTGRLLVFKLGGDESLPSPTLRDMTIPEQQLVAMSDEKIAEGEILYHDFCAPCHGLIARSGGVIADLRMMGSGSHENFNAIVLEGALTANGMASFADSLTADETAVIHAYVKARAHEDRQVAIGQAEAARLTWLK
ncbi:MAG: PQQ-dependent dehydrogenase, methanol/ethanol family, partial [Gammaproteobacteria bacterium]|nr:PQQ-dependent dehydrogenase, methanol/ethanol family [Gammaproteobacteria bacterium]